MGAKIATGIIVCALPLCLAAIAVHAAPPAPTDKATATASVTPRKLTSAKLGDFESGEMAPEKGGYGWMAFKFAQTDKKPEGAAKVVDGGVAPSKKALHFEGTIPEDAQMAFIGIGCGFGGTVEAPQWVDMSAFKGIRFRIRGDENPYRLALLTAPVKDYNYHGRNLVAEKEWTTVEVPFTEFVQTPGWGTPVALDTKQVSVVSISTLFQATGPAWFEIDDVELYK